MKVAVQDKETLMSLKPLEMAAYLRAKGWRATGDYHGKGSLWVLQDDSGTEFDVALPARRELGDYALRMGEALDTLAKVERRSQLDVLRDIQTTSVDLIRVRAPGGNAENGTLPFNDAVSFIERCREMMLAAACSALQKRPVYAKRKAQQAMDYLHQIRMGQTERGSYVLTILSPVAPELTPAQGVLLADELEAPYERRVTQTLMESLAALNHAAREAAVQGNMAPFQEAVGRGVSANLCDAVVGLSAAGLGEGLEVQVSWSRTRPVGNRSTERVLLGSDAIPLLQEAARRFRETAASEGVEGVEIEGVVTRLDRKKKAKEGEVTITGNAEGQMRRVKMMLGEEDYGKASQAHGLRQTVTCDGDLVKEGHGYRLRNPRHFMVVPESETP